MYHALGKISREPGWRGSTWPVGVPYARDVLAAKAGLELLSGEFGREEKLIA